MLATAVRQLADDCDLLRRQLAQHDLWYELPGVDLQYASDYLEGESDGLSCEEIIEKLQADGAHQKWQQENMKKLLAFRKKEM